MSLDWLSNGSIWMEFVDRGRSSEVSAPYATVQLRGLNMAGGAESRPFAAFAGGYWTLPDDPQRYSRVVAFGVFSLHLELQNGWEIARDCVNVCLSSHVLQADGRAIATLDPTTSLWRRLTDGRLLKGIRLEPDNRVSLAADDMIATTRRAWPANDGPRWIEHEQRALVAA